MPQLICDGAETEDCSREFLYEGPDEFEDDGDDEGYVEEWHDEDDTGEDDE